MDEVIKKVALTPRKYGLSMVLMNGDAVVQKPFRKPASGATTSGKMLSKPIDELCTRLMSELAQMPPEQARAELEEAGFVIRDDLEGHGLLNPDGTPFVFERDSLIGRRTT